MDILQVILFQDDKHNIKKSKSTLMFLLYVVLSVFVMVLVMVIEQILSS